MATLADDLRFGPSAVVARLRVPTADGTPPLGADRARVLLTNAVLPILALHADLHGDTALDALLVDTVESLPAVSDHITRAFVEAGAQVHSALDAHGLHHLATAYCDEGHCARCVVGQQLYPALARLEAAAPVAAT